MKVTTLFLVPCPSSLVTDMSWWGKIIGGAFGYMLGGPLGALFGAALGHQFDKGLNVSNWEGFIPAGGNQEQVQAAFFTALFSVMGHVAKADGRVSEDEIAMARSVMQQMALDEEQKRVAIELFNQGKSSSFDLEAVVGQFRRECHRRTTLIQMYLEVLIHAAYADGEMDAAEHNVLLQVSGLLGLNAYQYEQIEARVQAQRSFHQGATQAKPTKTLLKEAYSVIGVTESASDAEIKKAYRRLMNQHHPDKLVSRGMPEEMVKIATEKTQEIRKAYELIKDTRKGN